MGDQDAGFKVTDRRKFNADGTPREADEPQSLPAASEVEAKGEATERASGKVVSFPVEGKKQPEPDTSSRVTEGVAANPPVGASSAQTAASQAERAYNQASGPRPSGLPEASFLGLVNMLGVEAAMHMGLIETPGEGPPSLDLEAARHLIDTLAMLQAKTRDNLTADEENLLDSILADLRMQFVAISRSR